MKIFDRRTGKNVVFDTYKVRGTIRNLSLRSSRGKRGLRKLSVELPMWEVLRMTHENTIIERVAELDEDLAKEILAQIFLNVSRGDKNRAYNEIELLYRRTVVLPGVTGRRK